MKVAVDTITRFNAQVTKVGSYFAEVPSLIAVNEYVTKLALRMKARRVAVCGAKLGTSIFPPGRQFPFEIAVSSQMGRKDFFEVLKAAEIGISPVDLGVAETGTLIMATSDESERLVTALPPIHVAILTLPNLVSTLEDAQRHVSKLLTGNHGAVTISLISAPSRTTDVGGITIQGVHGPKELHVLLLDQELTGGT